MRPAANVPSSSTSAYERPPWSCSPKSDEFALEVIKNGVAMEEIPLVGREYFRIGRQPDVVDIPMEHGSISRLHAVLNFHEDGSLHIYDNRSANGTFVNKQRLRPQTYHKLSVGDIIKFGESTRINVLKGPESATDDKSDIEQLSQLRRAMKARAARQEESKDSGVTWGIQDDPDEPNGSDDEHGKSSLTDRNMKFVNGNLSLASANDTEDDERFRSGDGGVHAHRYNLPAYLQQDENYDRKYGAKFEVALDESLIKSDKDRELLDKIRKNERKIQNLQEEIRRIYLKEHNQEDGLTAGQQSVISRNDKAIADLTATISDLVKRLEQKQIDRSGSAAHVDVVPGKRPRVDDESDDAMVYDISQSTADVSTNWRLKKKLNKLSNAALDVSSKASDSKGLHQQSLSFKDIQSSVDVQQQHINDLKSTMESCTKDLEVLRNESVGVDEVTAVINKNRESELKSKISRVSVDYEEATIKMKQLQKLLHAAAPAMKIANVVAPIAKANTTEPVIVERVDHSNGSNQSQHVPTFSRTSDCGDTVELSEMERFMMEKDKDVDDTAAAGSAIDGTPAYSRDDNPPVKKPRIDSQKSAPAVFPSKAVVKGPVRPSLPLDNDDAGRNTSEAVRQGLISSRQVLQSGEMIWLPPSQQKGDGKTSLNEKLGY